MASLHRLGDGRHEREPARVLPFFPAYLAGTIGWRRLNEVHPGEVRP